MIRLGLDFDNTLVTYDYVFYKTALENKLIPKDFPKSKKRIRDFLRSRGEEDKFTLLQAEIYGKKLIDAKQADGMFKALIELKKREIELFIISHKTKYPYMGPKYNLHKAATVWLKKNNFFGTSGLSIPLENVFFELTKEDKVNKIKDLGCTHYIDDLPEILNMIDPRIKKILYNPFNFAIKEKDTINMRSWNFLEYCL